MKSPTNNLSSPSGGRKKSIAFNLSEEQERKVEEKTQQQQQAVLASSSTNNPLNSPNNRGSLMSPANVASSIMMNNSNSNNQQNAYNVASAGGNNFQQQQAPSAVAAAAGSGATSKNNSSESNLVHQYSGSLNQFPDFSNRRGLVSSGGDLFNPSSQQQQQQPNHRQSIVGPSPYHQMSPEFNPTSTLGRRAMLMPNGSTTSGVFGASIGSSPLIAMMQSTTGGMGMSLRDASGIPVPIAAQRQNYNMNNKDQQQQQLQDGGKQQGGGNNNNNNNDNNQYHTFTSAGGEEITTHYFHHDTFALTTALYINTGLFLTAITRIALTMNMDVISLSPAFSANIWIVVANGFACIVFIYYLYVEISGFISSYYRSSRKSNRKKRRLIRDLKRKERAALRKKYQLEQQKRGSTSEEANSNTPPTAQQQQQPNRSRQSNIITQRKNLLSGATKEENGIEMQQQQNENPELYFSDEDAVTDESDEDRADYYRQLAATSGAKTVNQKLPHNNNNNQQQQQQTVNDMNALDRENIERRRDLLDTVWIVAWASTLVTIYCEGGSGGGLTIVMIPLFLVMAPAFRVSVVPVVITALLAVGIIVALFLSHFPGSNFRRFELPVVPALVCVNFVVTMIMAAWVSHRRTREVEQLSDHYMTMLKIVASTTEHLLLLRTSEAVTSLSRIPAELFTAPQEKRVLNELLVFTQFLHELGSYFPQHIATAARNRLLMNSDAKLFAALGLNANELGFGGGGGMMMGPAGAGGGGPANANNNMINNNNNMNNNNRMNNQNNKSPDDDAMLGGGDEDDEEFERFEEESFSAMRKRMCTVMQITILDFPSYDVNKASQASLWLCENALERIEAQDGIVDVLTPSHIVASFNFHKPCAVRHSRLACECALSIAAALTHSESSISNNLLFSICIDTTQNVGGTVGTGFKRAEAMAGEGLDTITRLVPLTNILAVPILITERVQRNLGKQFETIPVDVAEIRWFQTERQKQITLYELRGSRPRNNMNSTTLADLFASAFSHFRRGDLNLAEENLAKWEKEIQKSGGQLSAEVADKSQARRLKAICHMYRKNTNLVFPKPFARRNVNWQLFVGEMPTAAGNRSTAQNDPSLISPLRERLKWQRQQISVLNGEDTNGMQQNPQDFDQLETTFQKIKDQQDAKVQEVTGGLMDFFVIASDDDDDDNNAFGSTNNNNNNNDNNAQSPSYQTFTAGEIKGENSIGSLNNTTSPGGDNNNASFGMGGGGQSDASAGAIASTVPSEITDIQEDRWTRSSEPIGSGGFSEVYLGLGGHGMLVAMKFFLLESAKSTMAELKNEVTLLSKLSHENIVSYVSCAFTSSHFVIIMEYVSGGSLHSLLRQFGPLPLQALKKYLFDILRGLQYLHSQGSVHCDVKPHNALLHNDGVVKLTDFGSTVNQMHHGKDGLMKTMDTNNNNNGGDDGLVVRGTAHYMAPEAAKNKISRASDIWSLGITVMELYTGKLPWTEKQMKTSPQNFVLALSDDDNLPVPVVSEQLHEDVRDFVMRCLVHDPKQRSTIEELLVSPLLAV